MDAMDAIGRARLPGATRDGDPATPRRVALILLVVALMAIALTWAYRSMRSVMEIGGACATGGPYVPAAPCPDGAWMIAPAVPVLIIGAMVGAALVINLPAPNLLLWMWGLLFGALGWNFIDFGIGPDGVVAGWLVCGIVFWLMAAPALTYRLWWAAFTVVSVLSAWFGAWSWARIAS